jgi:hypothetical protein
MTVPTLPFYARHQCIDQEDLQQLAAQRYLPPSLEQRRDSQGQYMSHRDIPEKKAQDQ